MALEELGEMTVGAAIPLLGDASTALTAAVGAELPNLQVNAAAFAGVSADIAISPPSAAIFAQAALDFQPPTVDANFGIDAAAELGVEIGDLNVYAALALSIAGLLVEAGVVAYAYDGPASGFVLPSNVGHAPNPGAQVFGIVLACQASATSTVASLKAVFGVP